MMYFEKDKLGRPFIRLVPFATKADEGGKYFRRKHGFRSAEIPAGQTGEIILNVPYDVVKINELEFTNAKEDVLVDFIVNDTATGAIQLSMGVPPEAVVPNAPLNQFGHDTELPNGLYRDKSDYDADLIKDMQLKIIIKNNTGQAYTAKGNVTYHEIRP
jgi:hypothetical protein